MLNLKAFFSLFKEDNIGNAFIKVSPKKKRHLLIVLFIIFLFNILRKILKIQGTYVYA
jgi:hypothetical protein